MTTFNWEHGLVCVRGPEGHQEELHYKLNPAANVDDHDELFHGDGNPLISHEPGFYTMSSQFF